MNLREKAKELMQCNYQAGGRRYITPAWPHYRYQWLWDSCFHAIICAELGMKDLAKNEIKKLLEWQKQDGFIPHMLFHGQSRWYDIERWTFKDRKFHSNYTQPAVMALALEAINNPEFTRKVLPQVIKFYAYFIEKQDPDSDGLISICHPCESGRDTDPTFDFIKSWKSKFGLLKYADVLLEVNCPYRRLDWDIKKIWQLNRFNVKDVMFVCIWIDGMRTLGRMVEDKKVKWAIKHLTDWVESAVYKKMWNEKDKIFYALDSNHQQIKNLTVSNLFPLILDNIPEKMLKGLVEHLTNPQEFWTNYPIPSTSVNDPGFQADYKRGMAPWRGPVWINMNWYLIRGLVKHGQKYPFLLDIADVIAKKTIDMVEREGFWECYHPFTGRGMRVENFGWSGLVVTFDRILKS